jgi:hypothetical protein
MPRVGFEPTNPASERAKTVHASDRAATVTGNQVTLVRQNLFFRIANVLNGVSLGTELGALIDSKLYFHRLVHYLFSHAMKLLGITDNFCFSFSSLHRFCYFTSCWSERNLNVQLSKILLASITDSNKL